MEKTIMPPAEYHIKVQKRISIDCLVHWFSKFTSCLVAFSGGVDSSLLAYAAHRALGRNALAVTSISPSFAKEELEEAKKIAEEIGIELALVNQNDLNDPNYVANLVSRCYFCRSHLVKAISPIVSQRGVQVCVDGTHLDDMDSPRPGVKALREAGFRAPFVELGFRKSDIRKVASVAGLSNAERPSESCLSSRVAYGQRIDGNTLSMIEVAESIVKELTGASIVRVRTIGSGAVIEVEPSKVKSAEEKRDEISTKFRTLGYTNVEIDFQGYKSGKMLSLFVKDLEDAKKN